MLPYARSHALANLSLFFVRLSTIRLYKAGVFCNVNGLVTDLLKMGQKKLFPRQTHFI